MLSSIGRASVRRVVARGPQSTNRTLPSFGLFRRVDALQHNDNASAHPQFSSSRQRSYATATKVTAKPGAGKTTATKTTTKTVAKTVKKKPVKKAAKKVVKKPVKKKAAAKKPVKKPAKKVLSERQKLIIEGNKKIAHKKALKEAALVTPKIKPKTVWAILVTEMSKGSAPGVSAIQTTPLASSKYKSLSPAELESYNHLAAQNVADNEAAYKKWVQTFSADQIRLANNARRTLRSLAGKKTTKASKVYPLIKDERQPKRATTALLFFSKERWQSGDLKGISLPDAAKLISKEWDALPASRKQEFYDLEAADKQRYAKDFKATFNRDPPNAVKD